jgi:tuftelin-interacting protein 11
MSDDSSGDDEPRMQFSTNNDFEDGQWIDGEFYAAKQKSGKKQTNDDRLYGVFQDASSGDSDGGSDGGKNRFKKSKGGGGRGNAPAASRPKDVHFVASSSASQTVDSGKHEKAATGGATTADLLAELESQEISANNLVKDIINTTKTSSASGVGKNNESFRDMLQQEKQKETDKEALKQKRLSAVPVNDMGKWEKHTKGVGRKLLNKFGFKGRLGAHEDGISAAVEVKVRPNTMGLGFGDFVEASALEANKRLEAEIKKEEYIPKAKPAAEQADRAQGEGAFSVEQRAASAAWKKSKSGGGAGLGEKRKRASKGEVVFQNAMDLMKSTEEGDFGSENKSSSMFVDMRGPTPRVLSDLRDIGRGGGQGGAEGASDAAPKLGQELLYNINMMVDTKQQELDREDRRYRLVVTRCADLSDQKEQLSGLVTEEERKLERLQKIHLILGRIEEKVVASGGDIAPSDVFRAFKALKKEFPVEYSLLGVMALVPHICRLMEGGKFESNSWLPLERPLLVAESFSPWFAGCSELEHPEHRWDEGTSAAAASSVTPGLMKLVESLCLFKIRRCIATDWCPKTNSENAVKFISSLYSSSGEYISGDVHKNILTYSVLPRLKTEVDKWQPTSDATPLHWWLHPWLPLLGAELSEVYPDIRRKLGKALASWSPEDESALLIISPWKGIFDDLSMDNLLQRAIVPKLVSATRALTVDPQSTTPAHTQLFSAILAWYRLVPSLHMVSMLEGEFFPRWLQILSFWLATAAADLSEISQWYIGWKSLFPEEMLANDRIAAYFNHALELMQHSLSGAEGTLDVLPGVAAGGSYFEVVERRKRDIAAVKRLKELRSEEGGGSSGSGSGSAAYHSANASAQGHSVSFKEVVEEFAQRNGVTFLPRMGRLQEGKQVFQFGKSSCFLDQGVVFMMKKKGNGQSSWDPIALDEMLSVS